jgi:hypothetical protein
VTTEFKVKNIADSNIDHTKESLVAPFELALVEYLHGNYGRILDVAVRRTSEKKVATRRWVRY